MPEKRDYYDVLGVSREASEKDIKSAYRKLAMKYHPDRSEAPDAEERFKEISEAYAVLSDTEKRRQYDQFGHAGISGQYSQEDLFRGVDFEDLLRGFGFGGGESIFDMFFGGRRAPARGRDLRYDLELTLEQAFTGIEREIEVPRIEACLTCGGSGARPGTSPAPCANCHGTGQITRTQRTPFGQMMTSTACSKCGGRGQIITSPCQDCAGSGRMHRVRRLNVKIPAGVETGQHLKLRGQGEAGPKGAPPGDLYVFVSVREHPIFRRVDSDLLLETHISMTQAVLGTEIEVATMQGKAKVKVPPGTQSGSIFRLRGKGMPGLHGGFGDMHVKVDVLIPKSLTSKQRQLLEDLAVEFGERKSQEKGLLEKIVDEVKGAVH